VPFGGQFSLAVAAAPIDRPVSLHLRGRHHHDVVQIYATSVSFIGAVHVADVRDMMIEAVNSVGLMGECGIGVLKCHGVV
jgi:hypothetical protein